MVKKVYIEKLEISNYRLCKKAVFKPGPDLSLVIGINGSGKTTLLRSFMLLKQLVTRDFLQRWAEHGDAIDPTTLKITLNVDGKRIIHISKMRIDNDDANNDRITSFVESWDLRDITGSTKRLKFPISLFARNSSRHMYRLHANSAKAYQTARRDGRIIVTMPYQDEIFADKTISAYLEKIAAFYSGITYYSASKFTNPSLCPVSFEYEDEHRNALVSNQGHLRWLMDMYEAYRRGTSGYESFKEIIGEDGIGLVDKIEFNEVGVSNINFSVRVGGKVQQRNKTAKLIIPQIHINNSVLSPSQLSEGTFKTLGILFYIMTGKGSLTLLEEPEVCIHHGLLSSLIELIQDGGYAKQMIVSTHSDYILDAVSPESVHVVTKDKKNGIKVTPLTDKLSKMDKKALKNYLDTEGSLGSYWRAGAID